MFCGCVRQIDQEPDESSAHRRVTLAFKGLYLHTPAIPHMQSVVPFRHYVLRSTEKDQREKEDRLLDPKVIWLYV